MHSVSNAQSSMPRGDPATNLAAPKAQVSAPELHPRTKNKPALSEQERESLRELQSLLYKPFSAEKHEILAVLAAIKAAQSGIETSLREQAASAREVAGSASPRVLNAESAPELRHPIQAWVQALAKAARANTGALDDFELHDMETLALALTACISLDEPNLFTSDGQLSQANHSALHTLMDALGQRFSSFEESLLESHPGPVLNIHNWITRALKSRLLKPCDSMRGISRHCFQLMQEWSRNKGVSGLAPTPQTEDEGKANQRQADTIKRAGKCIVQAQTMGDARNTLLALGGKQKANREAFAAVVQWLGSVDAIAQYLNGGEEGRVALSSLANLLKSMLKANQLGQDEATGNWIEQVLNGIGQVTAKCLGKSGERPLGNFCSLLAALSQPRFDTWINRHRASMDAACNALLQALSKLPQQSSSLDPRLAAAVFAFLRALEARQNRLAATQVNQGSGSPEAGGTSTTSTTSNTKTTTSTTALTTTTTVSPAAALPPAVSAATAGKAQRALLGQAAAQLLFLLNVDAVRSERKPEHLNLLLDVLYWLRMRLPVLVKHIDPLVQEVLMLITARRQAWPIDARPGLAHALRCLDRQGCIPDRIRPALLNAVLGTCQAGASWTMQDLYRASKATPDDEIPEPLPFVLEVEAEQARRPDPWSGGLVGESRLLPESDIRVVSRAPTPAPAMHPARALLSHLEKDEFVPAKNGLKAEQVQLPVASNHLAPALRPATPGNRGRGGNRGQSSERGNTSGRGRAKDQKAKTARSHAGKAADVTKTKGQQPENIDTLLAEFFEEEALSKARANSSNSSHAHPAADPTAATGKALTLQERAQALEDAGLTQLPDTLRRQLKRMENGELSQLENSLALSQLTKLADEGNASAQYKIGLLHKEGTFLPRDQKLAIKYLHLASAERPGGGGVRLVQACYALALAYRGWNTGEYLQLLRYCADNGHARAGYMLAVDYKSGMHAGKDLEAAFKYFKKAAELGDADAQFQLSACYRQGVGTQANQQEAQFWLQRSDTGTRAFTPVVIPASPNDTAVPTPITAALEKGSNSPAVSIPNQLHSFAPTSHWPTILAELDAPDANLPPPRTEQALRVAEKASMAEPPEPDAVYRMGVVMHNGDQWKIAAGCFGRAADLGHAAARHMLANYLRKGRLGRPNLQASIQNYEKAAQQGYPRAFLALGYCHETGTGATPNMTQAAEFYKFGAEAGDPSSTYLRGLCLFNGNGVSQDKEEGLRLIARARQFLPDLPAPSARTQQAKTQ